MGKVSKEFWVTDAFINDDQDIDLFNISRFRSANGKYNNKVTVTYEIDREVTIKESELEKAFEDIYIAGHSVIDTGVMDEVRKKLFGGGENE